MPISSFFAYWFQFKTVSPFRAISFSFTLPSPFHFPFLILSPLLCLSSILIHKCFCSCMKSIRRGQFHSYIAEVNLILIFDFFSTSVFHFLFTSAFSFPFPTVSFLLCFHLLLTSPFYLISQSHYVTMFPFSNFNFQSIPSQC